MILLDTGAWIAWTSWPSRLSSKAVDAILSAEKDRAILVSAASVWEVASKVASGKLTLDRDVRAWLAAATSYPGVQVLPIDPIDAVESTLLPGALHEDAVDRVLIAIARRLDCPIVTNSRAIRAYRHVKSIG